ncbi:unnamed protein product [Peniophora sp. CBMAI 1063]|nr:unnamed protein product [Peniophora sp. CBMAI 1063]
MMPASAHAVRHTDTLLGWIILTHICRRWRSIGLSATLAPLWARVVCLSWEPSVATELASRARGHPISIDLTRYNGVFGEGYNTLWPLEEWVLENIHKAGVLVAPSAVLLNRLSERRLVLPELRELHLGGRHVSDEDLLILWEAPGLQSATLSRVLLPPHMARGLRVLQLTIATFRMRLVAVHDFLRACSSLSTLDVTITGEWTHIDFSNEPVPGSFNHSEQAQWDRRVHLDQLKHAKIAVSVDQTVADLLQPIITPPDLSLHLVFSSGYSKDPQSRSRLILGTCAKELDRDLYDTLELRISESPTAYNTLHIRLSSSSPLISASCELEISTSDADIRDDTLVSLPSYMHTAAPLIRYLKFDASTADAINTDATFGALGRALTGVTELQLANMDYMLTAAYVRALRHFKPIPILPALKIVRVSAAQISSVPQLYQTRQWWDAVVSALEARKGAGVAVLDCLQLDGEWTGEGGWEKDEEKEGMEELKHQGLVEKVDHRHRRWASLAAPQRIC